jgi:hypothetical protein
MTDTMFPPVDQCVSVMSKGLAALGDLERWMAKHHPGYSGRTMASLALGEAGIGPWATEEQLFLPTRMAMWVIVLDDDLEQEATELDQVDELVDRCNAVVRTGQRDDSHPLTASLSGWQQEAAELPTYPALSSLWEKSVARTLDGYRYNWAAGWARDTGTTPPGLTMDVEEYFAHVGSSAIGQVHVPRWLTYGGEDVLEHLDVLLPALEDTHFVCRLANDIGTISRELSQPGHGHNNILMYDGVSEDWVRDQLDSRLASVRSRLAPLLADGDLEAIGILRLAEWCYFQYLGDHAVHGGAEFIVHGVD